MVTSALRAFLFDAYGTLIDVHSLATLAEELAPKQRGVLSQLWRTKQGTAFSPQWGFSRLQLTIRLSICGGNWLA